jgi:plasmid stabilization system protein ParE
VNYTLHPGAEQDIADALAFYIENAGPAIAGRFLTEFEHVAETLVEYPGLGTPTTGGRRSFPLRVFPYSVIYRDLGGEIRILVVRHQHRKAGHGGRRR